ncbi:hypothetical protein A3N53_01850 [Enterobacter hormaechei subsp. steigerwaltii]|nr:hypothetical protein A3N53_01850 [Enterobacter hormaechei subsp. steigerwaltii]
MKTIASTALPAHVQQPRYDREQLRSRIVHFGFGAFHRAHQALLTNRVLNAKGGDWGICEISLFSGDNNGLIAFGTFRQHGKQMILRPELAHKDIAAKEANLTNSPVASFGIQYPVC